jgi:hypothetical protein
MEIENVRLLDKKQVVCIILEKTLFSSRSPVDWSGGHVDSCGIAAAELRPRRRYDKEAQRRPAESEVPGTEINSPH